jgi:signal transduction histidine kinase/DNA-binding response OmpR family regulator
MCAALAIPIVDRLTGRVHPQRATGDLAYQDKRDSDSGQELRQRAAALESARDKAMAESWAKSQFLAEMSHEIRTPMSGIIGLSELLCKTPLDPLQKSYAQTIHDSGLALLRVIDDILDLSKIEAGYVTLDLTDLALATLVDEVVGLLSPRALAKGLRLFPRLSPALPEQLRGDPDRIRQVLINLVGNAVKFTAAGEVVVEAQSLEESEVGVLVRITVRDTGPGIDQKDQDVIFERFHRLEGADRTSGNGTGLGLAICKNLVRMMGGRIGLDSQVGEGCSFWIELTLARSAATVPGPDRATPALPSYGLAGLSVLVVEDNPVNATVALGTLEQWGCRAILARDGNQALEALAAAEPSFDLVLMDVQLPGMDGFAATDQIRRREAGTGHRTPIIAMTAHAMADDRARCLAAGMDGYVSKPVRAADLLATLVEFIPRLHGSTAPAASFRPEALSVCCGWEPGLHADVISVFLRETPGRIATIEEELRLQKLEAACRLAHALRGGCGVVGAERMAEVLSQLEAHARCGDPDEARSTFQLLGKEWARLRNELLLYIDRLSTTRKAATRAGQSPTSGAAEPPESNTISRKSVTLL